MNQAVRTNTSDGLTWSGKMLAHESVICPNVLERDPMQCLYSRTDGFRMIVRFDREIQARVVSGLSQCSIEFDEIDYWDIQCSRWP